MRDSVRRFGGRLAVTAQTRMGDEWESLSLDARADVQVTIADLGGLLLAQVAGERGLVEKIAEAEATIANWSWVGADRAREVVREILYEMAKVGGSLLAAWAVGMAKP